MHNFLPREVSLFAVINPTFLKMVQLVSGGVFRALQQLGRVPLESWKQLQFGHVSKRFSTGEFILQLILL